MHWCVTVPAFNIIFKIFMQLVAVVFKKILKIYILK
jgi:hypothetical protein